MKKLSLLILALVLALSAQAQLHGYKWRFGASAGVTNYYGDIRPFKLDNFSDFTKYYKHYKTYSDQFSYQLSIEYALGNSVGLMLSGGTYQFGSSDRFVQNDGTLLSESPRFDRALNFQTDVYDAGLSFVFKPDNNWLLSGKSFFAPYFTLGVGALSYEVHGDLLDASGNQYNYANENVIPDGTFETDLTKLGTERSDNYKTEAFYANLGLGVRFKITKTIEIFAQSDFKITNTDYLDDVAGVYRNTYDNAFQRYAAKPGTNSVSTDNPYRGMENGNPDWYIYHGMGIKISLGANKRSFNPPVITQRYTYVPTELSKAQMAKEDSSVNRPASTMPVTNNYFTLIQLPGYSESQVKGKPSELDSATLVQINSTLDSLETSQTELNETISATESELEVIDQTMFIAKQDTSVSAGITQTRVQNLESGKAIVQEKMASLNTLSIENQYKIDSLTNLKMDTSAPASLDSVSLMKELIIYPGQVSRILYSSNPSVLTLDSAKQTPVPSSQSTTPETKSNHETMTRTEFDEEIAKFRGDMLSSQATRDSAMMMAFATNTQFERSLQSALSEATYSGTLDEKTSRRLAKNRQKQNQLNEKNNELLRDALLVGGAAATTAAISDSGDRKKAEAASLNDSTLRARIAMDSVLIDSLSNIPRVVEVDTVTVVEIQEKTIETLLHESKVEVYFGINEFSITDQERDKLTPIADFMKKNPEVSVELVGFADNTGSVAYNITLTEKRVAEVTKTLTDFFKIAPDRISVSNGGLIVRGRSKGSVETDRKVEVRIIKR